MDNHASKKGIAGYWLVTMFVAISFAIVFITGGILYFLQAPASLDSFERTAQNWEKRVVKVEAGSEVSTGFIMQSKNYDGKDYVYIVTSYHGVDSDPTNVKIVFAGDRYNAENLSWNPLIDVAVFRIESNAKFTMPEIAKEQLATEVMALGYATGMTFCAEMGVVNSVDYVDNNGSLYPLLCYDVSSYVKGGMSGCPILTKEGKILGMGVRTRVDNVEGEEIHFSSDNYVVPFSIILAEYDLAINHKPAPYTNYTITKNSTSVTFAFDDKTVVYDGMHITLDGAEILKVNGKNVENVVDFIAKVSMYENRNDGKVTVTTKNGEVLIKVA